MAVAAVAIAKMAAVLLVAAMEGLQQTLGRDQVGGEERWSWGAGGGAGREGAVAGVEGGEAVAEEACRGTYRL